MQKQYVTKGASDESHHAELELCDGEVLPSPDEDADDEVGDLDDDDSFGEEVAFGFVVDFFGGHDVGGEDAFVDSGAEGVCI